MNKRIQELAKLAGAYWNHGDFNMGSSVEFQEGDLQKFAELIVRECINSVMDGTQEGDDYAMRIEKHFGVE